MTRISKDELQSRLDEAERHIESLQDELSQVSLHAGDLEDRLKETEVSTDQYDAVGAENHIECQHQQIEELAELAAELAEMLSYSFSIATSILTYRGLDRDRPRDLALLLTEDLDGFVVNFVNGDYDLENLIGALLSEQEAVSIAGNEPCGPDCTCQDDEFSGSGSIEVFLESLGEDSPFTNTELTDRFGHVDE